MHVRRQETLQTSGTPRRDDASHLNHPGHVARVPLAEICDRLVVIAGGRTVMQGTPAEVFGRIKELRELGLDAPDVTQVVAELVDGGLLPLGLTVCTLQQAIDVLGPLIAGPKLLAEQEL